MIDVDNYLRTLHLQRGATKEEIKKAYRRYALHFHPDKNNVKGYLFPYIHEAYRALMQDCENGLPGGASRRKANHDLCFVKERIRKIRPLRAKRFLSVPVLKVTDRSRQCENCSGYGLIGNHCLPMAVCRDCLGTGLRIK